MSSRTSTRKTAASRSRSEVQREFEALEKVIDTSEPVDPKTAETAVHRAQQLRAAVQGLSVETVVHKISALGLEISRALAGLSEQLSDKVRELEQVSDVVALEKEELERVHQIDVAKTALDLLVHEHRQKAQQLEEEMRTERAAWEKSQIEYTAQREQEAALFKLSHKRETEEYEYKTQLERQKAADEFAQRCQQEQREHEERQRALEKTWSEREAALSARETQYACLEEQVSNFDARLKDAVQNAVDNATTTVRAQLSTEYTLQQKDMQTEKRISEARIQSLEEIVVRQNEQISRLQAQLDTAKAQVQDIAVKAIDGASKRDALDQIMQVSRERDANLSRAKS